jgi:hypothetical protein
VNIVIDYRLGTQCYLVSKYDTDCLEKDAAFLFGVVG